MKFIELAFCKLQILAHAIAYDAGVGAMVVCKLLKQNNLDAGYDVAKGYFFFKQIFILFVQSIASLDF